MGELWTLWTARLSSAKFHRFNHHYFAREVPNIVPLLGERDMENYGSVRLTPIVGKMLKPTVKQVVTVELADSRMVE